MSYQNVDPCLATFSAPCARIISSASGSDRVLMEFNVVLVETLGLNIPNLVGNLRPTHCVNTLANLMHVCSRLGFESVELTWNIPNSTTTSFKTNLNQERQTHYSLIQYLLTATRHASFLDACKLLYRGQNLLRQTIECLVQIFNALF